MRYTADDYIAMRANAERGKWWTAAILIFAAIVAVHVLLNYVTTSDAPARDGDTDDLFETVLLYLLSIGAGVYCVVMGYLKKKFTLMDGGDETGESGDF
ncbi:hypothetical protein L0666_07925 [Octadecabacter sp. CECT 8868]|uniref:hypothetical protein n=1 Tax=Octadecabacter algicola TaxID=2909342 RepID=UPI001F2177B9|nr:hypothetical protein [Octadecabacter algicola]MCF2904912.1 hypothetical protein [Octadecabacter algicola]